MHWSAARGTNGRLCSRRIGPIVSVPLWRTMSTNNSRPTAWFEMARCVPMWSDVVQCAPMWSHVVRCGPMLSDVVISQTLELWRVDMWAPGCVTSWLWRIDCLTSWPCDELVMWRVDWQPWVSAYIVSRNDISYTYESDIDGITKCRTTT